MADDDLYVGENGDEMLDFSISEENDNAEEGHADEELFLQAVRLKMYRAELEIYRQAQCHSIDGTDVTRFISSVRVPSGYK